MQKLLESKKGKSLSLFSVMFRKGTPGCFSVQSSELSPNILPNTILSTYKINPYAYDSCTSNSSNSFVKAV